MASPAELALILWHRGDKGRLLTAELSSRYGSDDENSNAKVASRARRFFEELQEADWALPESHTKTQYMYRA